MAFDREKISQSYQNFIIRKIYFIMYKFLKGNTFIFIYLLYLIIVIFNLNSCYFWDNIAITSKEAHLFFDGDITNIFTQSKQQHCGHCLDISYGFLMF